MFPPLCFSPVAFLYFSHILSGIRASPQPSAQKGQTDQCEAVSLPKPDRSVQLRQLLFIPKHPNQAVRKALAGVLHCLLLIRLPVRIDAAKAHLSCLRLLFDLLSRQFPFRCTGQPRFSQAPSEAPAGWISRREGHREPGSGPFPSLRPKRLRFPAGALAGRDCPLCGMTSCCPLIWFVRRFSWFSPLISFHAVLSFCHVSIIKAYAACVNRKPIYRKPASR